MLNVIISFLIKLRPRKYFTACWLRGGPAVEHRSLAGVLSLSYAQPVADGRPLMWVNHPL